MGHGISDRNLGFALIGLGVVLMLLATFSLYRMLRESRSQDRVIRFRAPAKGAKKQP